MWCYDFATVCGIILLISNSVLGYVREEPMPEMLRECLSFMETKSSIHYTPSSAVDYMCINKYIYKTPELRWHPGKDVFAIDPLLQKDLKYCKKSLGLGETKSKRVHYTKRSIWNHLKAQARKKRNLQNNVVRKEYRMCTTEERERFHRAVQLLKQDTSIHPNVYDAICNLHPSSRAPNAHYGPGFLAYHRVLLWFFERQLQRKVPGAFLPFWDSTKDGQMANPTASVIFSSAFAGSGNGVVKDGPFANFHHPSVGVLVRNLEAGGGLMTSKQVNNVIKQLHTKDMITPFAKSTNNLEMAHAFVHAYVGGTLDNLNYSPADPLFWMHHCFVDSLWELQRKRAQRFGVDTDHDYPTVQGGHSKDATMLPFSNLKNEDGYSSRWTSTFYSYQKSPMRCRNDRDCQSRFYKCLRGRCIGRTIGEVYGVGHPARKKRSATTYKQTKTSPVKSGHADILSTYFPYLKNISQHSGTFYQYEHNLIPFPKKEIPVPETETPTQQAEARVTTDLSYEDIDINTMGLYHPLQNTFTIDGVEDTRNWVYLPVMVYYTRPAEVKYDAHPIRNGKVYADTDVYSSTRRDKYKLPKPGKTATSSTCKHIGSGAFKVYVKSYGLNYDGVFSDYAVVDERQPLSFALTQIGVKNPRLKNATAYVSVYDSCGRMCKAKCLIPGSKPARYKPCSGVVRVTPDAPYMYSSDIADANLYTYDYSTVPPCLSYDKVFLVFYCDQTVIWPWDQGGSTTGYAQPAQEAGFSSIWNPVQPSVFPSSASAFPSIGSYF